MLRLGFCILACFVTLASFEVQGQNLVPDPSFEIYKKCPTSISSSRGDFVSLKHWSNPTRGTPDYFNSCANAKSSVSTGFNIAGYAEPRTGHGYVGITNEGSRWREYVQCKLLSPLKADQEYQIEFWVSHAEKSRFCIKNLGLAISVERPFSYKGKALALDPQIYETECITDTANWTRISGVYVANGGEKWVTIGCFDPSAKALERLRPKRGVRSVDAYYYIEDVFIGLAMPEHDGPTVVMDTNTEDMERQNFILPGVFFTIGESRLSQAGIDALNDLLAELHNCTGCRLEVIGHTDDQGTEEFNKALSQDRAVEVAAHFKSKGISGQRILTNGMGATQPVADNTTEEGRAQNRRVEIVIRKH
ncbi:MAG: OmpA family protein [Bacteroidota bacterium]|nr:OmpA family protein [Bacteroidota bacterium]